MTLLVRKYLTQRLFSTHGLRCETRTFCSSGMRLRSNSRCVTYFNTDEPSKTSGSQKEAKICVPESELFSFLQFVEYSILSEQEQAIHRKHMEALERGDDMYKDPSTGYSVLTRLAHLRRGECCGSACRHCPFGHKAVPPDRPKKKFNSAFYV